eukprot:10107906-Alexandrium_andersonii.AAC.1
MEPPGGASRPCLAKPQNTGRQPHAGRGAPSTGRQPCASQGAPLTRRRGATASPPPSRQGQTR